MGAQKSFAALIILSSAVVLIESKSSRCYACRSRGSLGDCKDPFGFNGTDNIHGITTPSCISQWCAKFIEGVGGPPDEFGTAIERDCLAIGPSDNEERCVETLVSNKRTLLCFCKGDLCNSSPATISRYSTHLAVIFIGVANWLR